MAAPGHLVESNILLTIARRDDPDHAIVDAALARLAEGGTTLTHLLTLNPEDFKRYTHITTVHPGSLAYSG